MARFLIEHLPRTAARYRVTPLDADRVRAWLSEPDFHSLVRTTELSGALRESFDVPLAQADHAMTLEPGDEALFVSLSFSVLLAWAQGQIPPLDEDWRCFLIEVEVGPMSEESPDLSAADDLIGESTGTSNLKAT